MIELLAVLFISAPPLEDEPGWDCRIHGNRVCGVGNSQGVEPGTYSASDFEPDTGAYIGGFN